MKKNRTKQSASTPPSQTTETMAVLAEGMADDFNNILTTVMGVCSLIDKEALVNSELLQCVDVIRTSAERAAVLSDKLIQASYIERNSDGKNCSIHSLKLKKHQKRDKKNIDDIVSSNNKII